MNPKSSLLSHLKRVNNEKIFLELSLITIVLGLSWLMHLVDGYKLVILNLFYLPVVLSGFF